jgi:UDP-N-acetylglucosamine 1-carboxyvinyltransferase
VEKFIVEGGKTLRGEVDVSGAKNACLPIMAASLLARGKTTIGNVPDLRDVRTMTRVLENLGANVKYTDHGLEVDTSGISGWDAPYELVKTMRASYYVLGPLVATMGHARVSLPGGCAIGPRPIDLHIRGLKALSAEVKVEHGYIEVEAEDLRGGTINLEGPRGSSVGATIQVMIAAVLARGTTVIEHAALEPEVIDVADFLNKMGARVSGAGSSCIVIEGVESLHPASHRVIPDRIEAGTLAIAAAITRGEVRLNRCNPLHLTTVLDVLRENGFRVERGEDYIEIAPGSENQPFHVRVSPYPGFPTDMQAQLVALACTIQGISAITETIFENRFIYAFELIRMGARIRIDNNTAFVTGSSPLTGAQVMASDLRASAALVLAGLVANGVTVISRIYHLDRGYERLEEKLSSLGGTVTRSS